MDELHDGQQIQAKSNEEAWQHVAALCHEWLAKITECQHEGCELWPVNKRLQPYGVGLLMIAACDDHNPDE